MPDLLELSGLSGFPPALPPDPSSSKRFIQTSPFSSGNGNAFSLIRVPLLSDHPMPRRTQSVLSGSLRRFSWLYHSQCFFHNSSFLVECLRYRICMRENSRKYFCGGLHIYARGVGGKGCRAIDRLTCESCDVSANNV